MYRVADEEPKYWENFHTERFSPNQKRRLSVGLVPNMRFCNVECFPSGWFSLPGKRHLGPPGWTWLESKPIIIHPYNSYYDIRREKEKGELIKIKPWCYSYPLSGNLINLEPPGCNNLSLGAHDFLFSLLLHLFCNVRPIRVERHEFSIRME